ncbi:MAG: hypothetical protein WBB31_08020 [Saprospiraceae bacterium]
MKNLLLIFGITFTALSVFAQAPEKINYQGVARDNSGDVLANQAINLQIKIHSGTVGGPVVYQEIHSVTTNKFGLFNLQIGGGTVQSGIFSSIGWGGSSIYAEVLMDASGGSTYTSMGSQELISVPYALYAEKAGNNATYTGGSGIQINGNTITNIGDINPADDIITSSPAGGDLNGTFNNLQINTGAVGSPEIADGSIQSGDLNSMGATNGKVLKWNGSAWVPQDDLTGSNSLNGTQNYIGKFTPNGSIIGNSQIIDDGTNVGIGITSPDDKLDISGNSQVSGYLKVGTPSVPVISIGATPLPLYKYSYLSGPEAWSVFNECSSPYDHSIDEWYVNITGAKSGVIFYGPHGNYNHSYAYSPWIWIPEKSSKLTVEGTYYCNLENNSDGVYLEYIINGSTWKKIVKFDYGGYIDNADGCAKACNGTEPQICWNGINDTKFFRVDTSEFSSNTYGNWLRFRFVGMEDFSIGSGYVFELNGFSVTAFRGPTGVGGPFAAGNIYAEKNVFAGSNVLVGDIAEYFNVDVESEPGDLIAISSSKNDGYTICEGSYNPYILGIHSTNPTVTLNTPKGTPVCLAGRVPIKVCSESGQIRIGDYLTSASLPGYAMKANKSCFIVGRALENFEASTTGKILCIVQPGWYNPSASTKNQSGGSFFINNGSNSVTVNDPSISTNSRIFVTLRDNAGSYWVSNVSDGMFTINIEKTLENNIPFDYFVDNANAVEAKGDYPNNYIVKGETKILNPSIKDNSKRMQLQEYSDLMPPGSPPDPKSAWTWSKFAGYVKTGDQQK